MNKRQIIAMWIGVAAAVTVLIFPPWQHEGFLLQFNVFHQPLNNRPIDNSLQNHVWLMIAIVTSATMATLSDKRKS